MQVGAGMYDQKPIRKTTTYQPTAPQMIRHGGKVMNTTQFNVYILYYGANWTQSDKDIIEFFLKYSGKNTTKPDPWSPTSDYNHVENGKTYWAAYPELKEGKSTYQQPLTGQTVLSDTDVADFIEKAITDGNLLKDPAGVYFFLAGEEIRQQSSSLKGQSCVDFCGWHNWVTGGGGHSPSMAMKFNYFGYVQHPGADGSACWLQCGNRLNTKTSYFGNGEHTSPNKNVAIDQLVDILYHEMAEFVSNANGNAWYDENTGEEAADLCEEFYGVLNDQEKVWDSALEPGYYSYYNHVPMLARYDPTTTKNNDGYLPYYFNVEIFNRAWSQKRRFLLSAIYNPAERYWQTNGPWGYKVGCTTGHHTYWHTIA
jgi:hypothetical protein